MSHQLTSRDLPELINPQVDLYTYESIHAKEVGDFDPKKTAEKLEALEGQETLAVDLGGTKLAYATFSVEKGTVTQEEKTNFIYDEEKYLVTLEEIAKNAKEKGIPAGLSVAGPHYGNKLIKSPNALIFTKMLEDKYMGDLSSMFDKVVFDNDSVAGLKAGAMEAVRKNPLTKNVLFLINGSGLGGALLIDNKMYAIEPGHVTVVTELNKFEQNEPCGMFGNQEVCIERVVAGKAGIESTYRRLLGKDKSGHEISELYQQGDSFATQLYDLSATGTATAIVGMLKVFNLREELESTTIVYQGGVFNVPGYSERLGQILTHFLNARVNMIFTKDFSRHACLQGAATAALTQG